MVYFVAANASLVHPSAQPSHVPHKTRIRPAHQDHLRCVGAYASDVSSDVIHVMRSGDPSFGFCPPLPDFFRTSGTASPSQNITLLRPRAMSVRWVSTSRLALRSVHLRIIPRPTNLSESREIYRVLQRFGEITTYTNLRVRSLGTPTPLTAHR